MIFSSGFQDWSWKKFDLIITLIIYTMNDELAFTNTGNKPLSYGIIVSCIEKYFQCSKNVNSINYLQ